MGSGAGHGALPEPLKWKTCGGLSVAEVSRNRCLPALWPASRAAFIRSDDRHRDSLCSQVGALCWNIASQIANRYFRAADCFETLAGLLYTFILRRGNPPFPDVKAALRSGGGRGHCREAKPEKATVVPVTRNANFILA